MRPVTCVVVEKPDAEIEGCRLAHDQLRFIAAGLSDADIRQPSRLAGWSVGHLLSHLARNAEAMCRRIDAAEQGELIEQYVGGRAGRQAEIDLGASRSAPEIVGDVREWSIRLDDRFDALSDDVWGRPVLTVAGGEHPVGLLPFRRWREVEVHLVDLDVGIEPNDWTNGLVTRSLPRLIAGLGERAEQRELMAWLLGRGPAPDLTPWG